MKYHVLLLMLILLTLLQPYKFSIPLCLHTQTSINSLSFQIDFDINWFCLSFFTNMSDIKNIPGVNKLMNSRRGYKASITATLNKLKSIEPKTIPTQFFQQQNKMIDQWLNKIDLINNEIYQLCADESIEINLDSECMYIAETQMNLALIGGAIEDQKIDKNVNSHNNDNSFNDTIAEAITNMQANTMVPKLQCVKFNGNSSDKFAFKNFLSQFQNCVANMRSNSSKLSYLRSVLSDYAFSIISHLTITDSNYEVAINILRAEFLDNEYIVDEIFREILNSHPKYDNEFADVKKFLAKSRADLFELANSFNLDFVTSGSSGNILMSHIIFGRLPNVIKKDLIRISNTNYPSLDDIFNNYQNIIRTIIKTSKRLEVAQNASSKLPSVKPKKSFEIKVENKPTLENFSINSDKISEKVFYCKFCSTKGHSMLNCTKYSDFDARKKRCKEMNLCELCSSVKHTTQNCYGIKDNLSFSCKFCDSKTHISALCSKLKNAKSINSNLCLNTGITENLYLLPIVQITVNYSKNSYSFNVLLDTGSQRSYFSDKVLNNLNINKDKLRNVPYEVKTYISSEIKQLKEVLLDVEIGHNKFLPLPILIDNYFNIEFQIADLNKALSNFNNMNLNLAAKFNQSDKVEVDGLIGVDYIQFLQPIKHVNLLNGSAWQIFDKICPYGNILHFLHKNQITPVTYENKNKLNSSIESQSDKKVNCNLNYNSIISRYSGGKNSKINFVLKPKQTYDDPFVEIFNDSDVERRIDNMLNIDILENCAEGSTYDSDQIKLFSESIEYKDGSYHVKLPWLKNIKHVPSNYKIALSVLDRVIKNLESKNLFNEYCEVFKQQEKENIIERFHVEPENYNRFIWIPHRAVVREGPLVTTKVRPVFNCSLKSKGSFSLNECAYPGINLLRDLTELLLCFRTNDYAMLSDIRKAFLQIRLASDDDRNRFCFFMRENDKLITYKYNTILFGFNCSPFILNFIIKYHLRKYPDDLCNKVLNSGFYCDNLITTGNDINEMHSLYKESIKRMHEGGFSLRSWNSNSLKLQEVMKKDNTMSDHGLNEEKVLGYKYNVSLDSIKISNDAIDLNINSKRKILSQLSSIFDPLGLCLPVTVRGKFFIKNLWSKKLEWDQEVDSSIKISWSKLAVDLNKLCTLNFPRNVVNNKYQTSLFIFCDASSEAYGFCAYAVQNNNSNLLFSKAKVSPLKSKTLPTLELLGVYTAFKCLKLILRSYSDLTINDVFILVDAQVVLSWLLNDVNKINSKNKFVINRLKEINVIKNEIINDFKIDLKFKYVPTNDNPADLLSRGLSFNKFVKNFEFWTQGPTWLRSSPVAFPNSELNCLNDYNKVLVSSNLVTNLNTENKIEPLISFNRFSSFDKLVTAVSFVYKFIKPKNSQFNEVVLAKNYLIKVMQLQAFSNEINYLSNPSATKPPDLVRNLDLFLDEQNILRSRGRINKTQYYDYNITNPILIAKDHELTKLIVMSIHNKIKHMGLGTTLTQIRLAGFWIPRARQAIKNVLSKCFICKRYNSLSFKYPKICNLPKSRVNLVKPFREVGIDYTSHIFLNTSENNNTKMYLLLFTCLQIRAIHVEIVQDMSTKSFIQALIRFTNIYGIPSTIYSDNARSFIAAFEGNIISYHLKTNEFKNKFQIYNINHKRIPLYSPWYGSCWERLIKIVKSCLYKSIGRSKLNYFELLTLISDIQSSVNSRPLTYRCSDDKELEIITPNSFLRPNINTGIIVNTRQENSDNLDPPSRLELVKSLENREELINKFKSSWYDEYLLSLREVSKDLHQSSFQNRIKIHDVVLIRNPAKPRPYWYLGRVIDLIVGEDGIIRSVKLKRGDGADVLHSLKHLYPLELSITHDHHPQKPIDDTVSNHDLNISYSSLPDLDDQEFDLGNPNNLTNSNNYNLNNSLENIQEITQTSSRPKRKNAGVKKDPIYDYY